MAAGEPSPFDRSERPFQFTLQQLLWLMGIVCVLSAAYYWIETALFVVIFGFACLSVMAFFVYLASSNKYFGPLVAITAVVLLIGLMLPALSTPRISSRRSYCQNNLRNLAIALQMYEAAHGSLPPPYIADADGKPMHSWRVLLLPYIEQQNLYSQYRFDEPWNGPNNSKLHGIRLRLFECPSDVHASTDTSYVAVVGDETVWRETNKTSMAHIRDGASNTIMLVEIQNSGIHWMEPRDLRFDQMPMAINPPCGQNISSGHQGGASVACADCSIRFLTDRISPKALRAAFTRNGKEPLDFTGETQP